MPPHMPRSTRSTQTHSHHHHQPPSAINPINPDPQPPSPSATISHQPDQPRPTYPDQPDQTIPRSTHNLNQPRPSKPTQIKTDPHHKLRLNHHRGLPTSLPSIINSNPHRHHRDHATRHTLISPQRRSHHSADLAMLVACYERERERDVREGERTEDERMGWVFCERKKERTAREWE